LNQRKQAPLSQIQLALPRNEKGLANQRTALVGTSDQDLTLLTTGILRRKQPRARLNQPRNQKESFMKLNSSQVERALMQFDAQALPDDHPVVPQLASMFGDHTFFLDSGGLNVLEPTEASAMESPIGMIVNLAYWSDETLTKLSPHEPEPTGVIVSLESKH
jgi:hypothetical protein